MSSLALNLAFNASIKGVVAPDGSHRFSVYDFITLACQKTDGGGYARTVFYRLIADDSDFKGEITSQCHNIHFPGGRGAATPTMTVLGLQKLLSILGTKVAVEFRALLEDTFTRVMAGDTSLIKVIQAHAASDAPIHQAYRKESLPGKPMKESCSAVATIEMDVMNTEMQKEFIITPSIISMIDRLDAFEEDAIVPYQSVGYVYAAWNPLFEGLIKIGATMRQNPLIRVTELSKSAGIPEPFQLIASIASKDPFTLEKEIHRHYGNVRKYGKRKEFFVINRVDIVEQFHLRTVNSFMMQTPRKGRAPNSRAQQLMDEMGVFFRNAFVSNPSSTGHLNIQEIMELFTQSRGNTTDLERRLFQRHAKAVMQSAWPGAKYATYRTRKHCFKFVGLRQQ